MCDTMVRVPAQPGLPLLFGKSSDREPGEAQIVEAIAPGTTPRGATVRCTHVSVPDRATRHGLLLSRPFWMWGCEMGANDRGVVGGNEAVFTRVPVERTGLLGMDLLRLALERAASAREAVEVVIGLLGHHGQGGGAGYRNRNFRYHNSFIFADGGEAWVLETAGRWWAAQRARGARTISNVLTIEEGADLVHPDAADEARRRGWRRDGETFSFARAFGAPLYRPLTGGDTRRACTRAALERGAPSVTALMAALRSHEGHDPADGLRMIMPCAHAAPWPTRTAGQTVGAMVSELGPGGARHFLTGTSAPCLSVFKPAPLDGGGGFGPPPGAGFDGESLFWRHERLHRVVLADYAARAAAIREAQVALEHDALAGGGRDIWETHRSVLPDWIRGASAVPARGRHPLFKLYWRRQSRVDHVPA